VLQGKPLNRQMRTDSRFAYDGAERRRHSTYLALVVVDSSAAVRFSFWDGERGEEAGRILCEDRSHLRPEIERLVSTFVAENGPDYAVGTRVVRLNDERALRLSPLVGHDETLFALIVETHRHYDSIARAAGRFQLTRRQTEVLALVLEGATAGEIALRLSISEYTAQGYIKSLLGKTASRNRSAMVAKVLEWSEGASAQAQGSALDRIVEPLSAMNR
jgi:DNA-binding CsgD family transcriptional regulator